MDARRRKITATVIAPLNMVSRLVGLPVIFQAQGGGIFAQPNVLLPASLTAQTDYTAGYSAGESSPIITAILDVPGLPRVEASTTITLRHEDLQLDIPFAYGVDVGALPGALPFTLNAPISAGGSYIVRLDVETGGLSNDVVYSANLFTSITAQTGKTTQVYFSPPPGSASGSTRLCVEVAERGDLGITCHMIVWGNRINTLGAQETPLETVYLGRDNVHLRLLPTSATMAALCYEIAYADPPITDPNFLFDAFLGTALAASTSQTSNCRAEAINAGATAAPLRMRAALFIHRDRLPRPDLPRTNTIR